MTSSGTGTEEFAARLAAGSTRPTEPRQAETSRQAETYRGGLEPIHSPEGLAAAVEVIAASSGPIAADAERAASFRYSSRAYLIQLRRGAGPTFLIDPIACPDLTPLDRVLRDTEWVLHAASQDLPCLAETGLRPSRLFDTELAARLLGHFRVALATLVDALLDVHLVKGQGAADWSARPLRPHLLEYAALDVEYLLPLRELLDADLARTGKRQWAMEEFEAVRRTGLEPARPRIDPWRRVSGSSRLRSPRQRAALRAAWHARDALAAERDLAPFRVISDAALIELVLQAPTTVAEVLATSAVRRSKVSRADAAIWLATLRGAQQLPETDLPGPTPRLAGPPASPGRWSERDPEAADRLARVRGALRAEAELLRLPLENLLPPDLVRRICWEPPERSDAGLIATALRTGGAREWQVLRCAPLITAALDRPTPSEGSEASGSGAPVQLVTHE